MMMMMMMMMMIITIIIITVSRSLIVIFDVYFCLSRVFCYIFFSCDCTKLQAIHIQGWKRNSILKYVFREKALHVMKYAILMQNI
jgi:hypothetical protein